SKTARIGRENLVNAITLQPQTELNFEISVAVPAAAQNGDLAVSVYFRDKVGSVLAFNAAYVKLVNQSEQLLKVGPAQQKLMVNGSETFEAFEKQVVATTDSLGVFVPLKNLSPANLN